MVSKYLFFLNLLLLKFITRLEKNYCGHYISRVILIRVAHGQPLNAIECLFAFDGCIIIEFYFNC